MSVKEIDNPKQTEAEFRAEAYYEGRIIGFRDQVLLFFREKRLGIGALNLSKGQEGSFNRLLESRKIDFDSFIKTRLLSTSGELVLSYGYRTLGRIGTTSLLTIRWDVSSDRPITVFVDGLLVCQRTGRLKFLFSDNVSGEEIVQREQFYDEEGDSVEKERYYKKIGILNHKGVNYSVFGCNLLSKSF